VLHRGNRIVAYIHFRQAQFTRKNPHALAKGLSQAPIGVILLARLAVDLSERGAGFGKGIVVWMA